MGYLPDLIDGKIDMSQLDAAEKKLVKKGFSYSTISPEKKRKLREEIERIKARKLENELKNADRHMAEINNDGRKEVSEDFSDSPFADREPIKEEDDE